MGLSSVPVIIYLASPSIESIYRSSWRDKVHPERAGESGRKRTFAGGIEGLHVEDVNTLHLTQDLQSLETGGLLEIRGHGAGRGAGADEVLWLLDLCLRNKNISNPALARDELTTAWRPKKAPMPSYLRGSHKHTFELLHLVADGAGGRGRPSGFSCGRHVSVRKLSFWSRHSSEGRAYGARWSS